MKTQEIERIFTSDGLVFHIFYAEQIEDNKKLLFGTAIGMQYHIHHGEYGKICFLNNFVGKSTTELDSQIEIYISIELDLLIVEQLPHGQELDEYEDLTKF